MKQTFYVSTDAGSVRFQSFTSAWRYFWAYCQAFELFHYDDSGERVTLAGGAR